MIKVTIECPFEVWQINDADYEGREIEVKETDCDLIEGCLNSNCNFLEDLNDYAEEGQLKTDFILPNSRPKFDDFGKPYLEVCAYSSAESLTDRDLGKIAEYVSGQVSDGWGENGFDLWGGRRLELNWENMVHRGCTVISDNDVLEIWKQFKRLKAHAFNQTYPDYNLEDETKTWTELLNDLTETFGKLVDELHAINEKHENSKAPAKVSLHD